MDCYCNTVLLFSVEDYCDQRGSLSTQPNPITRRCECKVHSSSISLAFYNLVNNGIIIYDTVCRPS